MLRDRRTLNGGVSSGGVVGVGGLGRGGERGGGGRVLSYCSIMGDNDVDKLC